MHKFFQKSTDTTVIIECFTETDEALSYRIISKVNDTVN